MNCHAVTTPLAPNTYWQPEWFEREKKEIFAHSWIFVGFKENVSEHNSYISTTVAGTPVIIRNMNDRIVAFRNVCSHRYSIIHPAGCGKSAFRCPFHGWTFDVNGVPIGIPENEESFGYNQADKRSLALDPVSVDNCGRYLFVRMTPVGVPLRQWLGPLAEVLEHTSSLFTNVYFEDKNPWACNWKSATEITMEGYHGPYVHPESFYRHVKATDPDKQTEDTEVDYRVDFWNPHSAEYSPLSFDTSKQLSVIHKRLQLPRSDKMRGYIHYIIYPNTMLAVYSGLNATVIRFDPVTPEHTTAERWLMTGMPDNAKITEGIPWRMVTQKWEEEGSTILEEDRKACEMAQLGVRHALQNGQLGKSEQRVRHYQSMLSENMDRIKNIA